MGPLPLSGSQRFTNNEQQKKQILSCTLFPFDLSSLLFDFRCLPPLPPPGSRIFPDKEQRKKETSHAPIFPFDLSPFLFGFRRLPPLPPPELWDIPRHGGQQKKQNLSCAH